MEQIRVVELFAGVGGFRLGLEQASSCFQTVWANQWEPSMRSQFAFECYERHFGHRPEHVCQDIVTAKENIPPHDLLVGGFPCQDYSIAKKGARGIEGKKGVLWWEINAILRTHRPRYVLLENVDRLIKSPAWQKGRDFSIILRCFYEAGYAVEWRVINAADYGEAQRRRRTFLFAFRNDTALFRKAADLICVEGLKGAHQLLLQDGFFAPIFPLYGFERKYSEGWLDEFRYLDLKDLSAAQSCHFYASGLMVNGRFYSVESIPFNSHISRSAPCWKSPHLQSDISFPPPTSTTGGISRAQSRRFATAGTVLLISFRKAPWRSLIVPTFLPVRCLPAKAPFPAAPM